MNKYVKSIIKNTILDFSRNKVRTFLTSLGIMIGVLSVVMLIALGLGLRNFIAQQFEGLGANIIVIAPGDGPTGGFSGLANPVRFDERDVRALSRIDELDYIVPAYITNGNVDSGEKEAIGTILATSDEYFDLFSLKIISGEKFSKSDLNSSKKVAYVGRALAEKLYDDPEDVVGRTVRTRNLRLKVIGLIDNVGVPERDNAIFIPYTVSFASFNTDKTFFAIYTGVKNEEKVDIAKKNIEEVLTKRYDEDEFEPIEPSDLLETIGEIFNIVNGVLIAIGSISLLVGGIGIMNIMYATVTERTREIGIRRAIGATKRDILLQFVAESTILSLFGGFLGLGVAGLIVLILRNFFPAEINLLSVILALGISSFIGIFFGSFPARRAANLTPIEAIRSK